MTIGLVITIMMTLIILVGPLPRAIQDKDYNEILVDFILIGTFWTGYYILSFVNIDEMDILNRLLN